ncbi:ribosomal protein L28e [Ascodesmis nigricans]|uniref:Ribosomal protein L28e n=1 Tax=Ascodesmis nigricans TaxID=341454 RepID=A0A4S2MWS3_9PEZI|nr:ribosomal protein L28e [Ascodesmis nigricans]
MASSNFSSDVFWLVTRNQSSYIVKRGHGSGVTVFSKEPLNLTNKHSRKQSGVVNEKAVGVQPGERGVVLITKNNAEKNGQKPATLFKKTPLKKHNRKVYATIASTVAKKGYRPDLRADAVARASNIIASQRQKKDKPAPKPRGKKAKAQAQAKSSA